MAATTGDETQKDPAARRGRGFARAGGLISPQMRTAAARRGFLEAKLRALWGEIAGMEIAAVSEPQKLATARGPAGGLLRLSVDGAHAPQLQMMLPQLVERINAALGPGTVGRIQLVQGGGPRTRTPPPASPARAPAPETADIAEVEPTLSSIGDDGLRRALETLARNVVSRERKRNG
jgi:hypothetical protein